MSEETKVVETGAEAATAQTEVDYEAIIAQKDAELEKVSVERENYRRGMLKAKGKLPAEDHADDDRPEDWRDEARRIAREELLQTQESRIQAEKTEAYAAVLRRNKELTLALKNRGQISSTSAQGSNQEKPEGKADSYFSNAQIQDLKKRGWSDEKIETAKRNMLRGSEMPKP